MARNFVYLHSSLEELGKFKGTDRGMDLAFLIENSTTFSDCDVLGWG